MKINPIISFKSNIEALKTPPHNAVATNPIQNSQDLQATALDYKVKTPMKYSDLGELELPCSTKGHLYKLENGQRVVIITKIGPTVVKTYVNSGSMNEPDKFRGISHFIEHNLFNGSEGLSAGQFFDTVNKMGANTNASTGFAATDYYIESNLLKKNDLEKEIKIHAS
ncbi:MAG TPA: insulinase family protein, partial [Candidatus Gastranaerophilaceae bacterium]|nr:insulinase family protein [Candidatus Gastranaerophilaceae bacterium]